jgi:hypothetical protein
MAVALVEHQTRSLTLELCGKGTTLLGHQTPLCGEHSRINECPVSLAHYSLPGSQDRPCKRCRYVLAGKRYDRQTLRQYWDRYGMQLVIPLRKMYRKPPAGSASTV